MVGHISNTDTGTGSYNITLRFNENRFAQDVRPPIQVKLKKSITDAVVQGSGWNMKGDETLLLSEEGLTVSRPYEENPILITYAAAYENMVGYATALRQRLELNDMQAHEQAEGWYKVSLFAALIGLLLISITVATFLLDNTTVGLITAISSFVPNAAAALFFRQLKAANERIDNIQKRLVEAIRMKEAIDIVKGVTNDEDRNRLKSHVVMHMIGAQQVKR